MLCLINNFASYYRKAIYQLMNSELQCHFVFGDGDPQNPGIRKLDYSLLDNFDKEIKNKNLWRSLWYQTGVLRLLFGRYDRFIIVQELRWVSTWLFLLLGCLMPKKKIYLWAHGMYGQESTFRRFLLKIFFGLSDGIFLYGNYAAELIKELGVPKHKIAVIHNSLDYNEHLRLRDKLKRTDIYERHFSNTFPVLIFSGRLTKKKRLDLVLSALVKLPECNLILIGNGEERDALDKLSVQQGIQNRVWFLGACYDELLLAELIYNADLCVSPGNVGLTAIHSMSFGTPVITHDDFSRQMPEFEAIREGSTGTFFSYNDVDSLVDCVRNWLSSHQNREVVRKACYEEIDCLWNPYKQIEIFKEYINNNKFAKFEK